VNAGRDDRNGNCRQRRRLGPVKTLSGHGSIDREFRPGGHSHTVIIDYDGTRLAVDVGYIVYNELNYPDLSALFAHLGVETVDSCMSFAVTADTGRFEWKAAATTGSKPQTACSRNAAICLSPSYLWMLRTS